MLHYIKENQEIYGFNEKSFLALLFFLSCNFNYNILTIINSC